MTPSAAHSRGAPCKFRLLALTTGGFVSIGIHSPSCIAQLPAQACFPQNQCGRCNPSGLHASATCCNLPQPCTSLLAQALTTLWILSVPRISSSAPFDQHSIAHVSARVNSAIHSGHLSDLFPNLLDQPLLHNRPDKLNVSDRRPGNIDNAVIVFWDCLLNWSIALALPLWLCASPSLQPFALQRLKSSSPPLSPWL